MAFTTATLAEARSYADRAKAKMAAFRQENSKKIAAGVAAVETTGTAYAFGFLNGRFGGERGEMSIGGVVPIDLLAGTALHALAFFNGLDDEQAPHAHAIGTGALASCAYRYGQRLGESMAVNAGAKTAPAAFGANAPHAQLGAAAPRIVATPNGQQYTVVQHP
jgi:hypothetical protein